MTLSCETPGALIYYHWLKDAPENWWYSFAPGLYILATEHSTYYACAEKPGMKKSEIVSATYVVAVDPSRVAKPTLSPDASEGPFVRPQEIQFATATDGATLLYTHDEEAPKESWMAADSVKLYFQARSGSWR